MLSITFKEPLTHHPQGVSPGGAVFPYELILRQVDDHTLELQTPEWIELDWISPSVCAIELYFPNVRIDMVIGKVERLVFGI